MIYIKHSSYIYHITKKNELVDEKILKIKGADFNGPY